MYVIASTLYSALHWLPFSSNGALDMKWKLINGASLLLAFCYGLQKGIGQSG
jgi:hypothetical protein